MEMEQLKKEIAQLKQQVQELQKKVLDMSLFQDDFSNQTIIRRDTQFIGKVYDKDGNVVIN